MINRAGNKEKAKRVLNENGNLSGMVGMEILYRVIAAITSVLLGAMIAGGIGVVSAVVSAPFKLFGLAGIIIAYVLITPIATLVGAIAGGAVAGPFEVARYRYYLSLRKNGIRPKVTCIFDAFDFFMQFALVTGVRMLTIMWIPVLIQFATLLLAAVVAAASRSYLAAMLLVMIGMIAALVVAAYRSYQFWPMALVQADHPQLNAEQVMERCKVMTEGHKFDLFVFDLSYLGWNILSLLTGGILSVLYVAPYKMIATAFVRLTRSSMLEVMRQDYVTTARAKGVSKKDVTFRHQLRNSMIPIVTTMGMRLGSMVGSTVLIESLFVIPGLGSVMMNGISNRDFMLVANGVLIISIFVAICNLVVDILYGIIDPRTR